MIRTKMYNGSGNVLRPGYNAVSAMCAMATQRNISGATPENPRACYFVGMSPSQTNETAASVGSADQRQNTAYVWRMDVARVDVNIGRSAYEIFNHPFDKSTQVPWIRRPNLPCLPLTMKILLLLSCGALAVARRLSVGATCMRPMRIPRS